jgi:hypothetical protein
MFSLKSMTKLEDLTVPGTFEPVFVITSQEGTISTPAPHLVLLSPQPVYVVPVLSVPARK